MDQSCYLEQNVRLIVLYRYWEITIATIFNNNAGDGHRESWTDNTQNVEVYL